MFCNKCGSKIDEGERFCGSCGNPVAQMQAPSQVAPAQDETVMAAAAAPAVNDATVMAAAAAPAAMDATVMAAAAAPSAMDATVMATAAAPAAIDATVMASATAPVQPQAPVQGQYQMPVQPQAPVQGQYQMPAQPQAPVQGQYVTQTQPMPQIGQSLMQPDPAAQNGAAQGTTLVAKKKKPWIKFVVIGGILIVLGGIVASLFAFGAVDKINSRLKTAAAEKYFADMDYKSAIASYKDAIEIDPSNVDAYLGLAEVYIAQEDYEAAIDILKKGIKETGSSVLEDKLEEVYEMDRCFFGHVYKVDTDTDPTNNEPLVGAVVEIEFPNGKTKSYTTDDNGYYETETEIPSGKYEIRYYYNDEYIDYTEVIKADEGRVNENVYLEPLIYADFYGNILIGDEDTDYTNNYPLEGAEVKIEKLNASNSYEATTYTNYNGTYEFYDLLMGVYKLVIHMDGYIDVVQNVVVYEGQTEVYNAMIELIPEQYSGEGYATGMIYDAVNGYGVEGMTLYIRSGINNTDGAVVATTTTNDYGEYYTPALPSGNYCIEVVDERDVEEPYISTQINVKILGGITIYNQDATVSSVLVDGQFRIVLTWGSQPYDLDSHLIIETPNHYGHVYYSDSYDYDYNAGVEIADLDLDDTDSYGPETTTIYNSMGGDFLFYVHNFTRDSYTGLANSGATVMIYTVGATSPSYIFYVPYGEGYVWDVFSYDASTGIITPINEINYDNEYYYDSYSDSWVKY